MLGRSAAAAFALGACLAGAAGTAQWPPPAGVEARMRELQSVLGNRDATAAQRESAREELSNLLKSPAGQARGRTADEKPARAPRAAIEPLPSMVKPAENPLVVQPPVAHVEVIVPPKAIVIPQSGAVAAPSGRFAVDPRTGAVLHEIPGGYIDPRTGQVTPR
jgi:hypothetical protein